MTFAPSPDSPPLASPSSLRTPQVPRRRRRPVPLERGLPAAPPAWLSDYDLYLFGEGRHFEIYQKLGAHPCLDRQGVAGVHFAVWAPNARRIELVGDFNGWSGGDHALQPVGSSGIWQRFVPQLGPGTLYKYRMTGAEGRTVDKCDPFGFAAEIPPRTASIVADLTRYAWGDGDWMARRVERNPLRQPISVYEVHLGSWMQAPEGPHGWLNYRELARRLVDYCQRLGFTHVELMPVSEHPYTGSWGYQTVGYFAATSRYGEPDDLRALIDYCHQNGVGVILDFVPGHFPKDEHGLARFDGTPLFEHADPRQGEHPDWNTLVFNYGRHEVANFLIASGLFWLDQYHVDGLRVDAVASMLYLDYSRSPGAWLPNRFGGRENLEAIELLQRFNEQVHARFPGVLTIAEESTAWPGVSHPVSSGGLGFSMKWNMGWMNDTLRYQHRQSVHRRYHHHDLTFSLIYAFSEQFMLPLSHDEVVHGKGSLIAQMPGDPWQQAANLRLLYGYMWTHPGKKLLFMGSEFGQRREWCWERPLDWHLLEHPEHQQLQRLVADLNRLYRQTPALYEVDFAPQGFEWIDCQNAEQSVLSYLRYAADREQFIVAACNFTPVVREDYRIGVPLPGLYREIFNSDADVYGGSGIVQTQPIATAAIETHGRPHALTLRLPPLALSLWQLCTGVEPPCWDSSEAEPG